ncbi:sugar transferase [Rhizobium sp. BK377]|jgi:lipopolysaccharide/colanic/teichoic acid biosynthesis glycosyltransferase|uniref:sugar transferase n=2 Tax=unclassified Rhizobium TaxID=2613769 RepID=UPI00391843A5
MNVFTPNKFQDTAFSAKAVRMKAFDAANSNIRQPQSFASLSGRSRLQFGLKRAFDIFGATSALVILFPVLLTIALFIVIDDGGPVFFRQIRWGLKGSKITVYKFRSMRVDLCDPTGVEQTVKGDRRVTRIGAFLRKTNIDELPQLLNVIKGDMSLIGPRCHAINMRAAGMLYEELVPDYHYRHLMRPGITGLAQTRGWRGPTERPTEARARIASDIYYIRNFSLWLDLKILFRTLLSELRGGTGF